MPPPNQPSQPKVRILNPYEAKRLARKPAAPETPNYPSLLNRESPGPSLTRKPFLPRFISSIRERYASLPTPLRRTCRVVGIFGTFLPIGLFFSSHVAQLVWVRGPSMTPYLNEDYDQSHTKSDMVLVSMWPYEGWPWPGRRQRRIERGMIVTFR